MSEPKKFTIEERVRWGDVDAARIIFYGAYIRFFEIAETELFRAAGAHGDLHIIGGVDHFMFNETDRRVADIVRNWLARSFPVE